VAGAAETRVDGQAQQAAVPVVLDLGAQVDDLGGGGVGGESNTLTMPPFSPMNTLPPGAKAIAVGRVSPDQTSPSENPLGTAAATAGDVGAADRVARPKTAPPRAWDGGGAADTGAADSSATPKATTKANEQVCRAVRRAGLPPLSRVITALPPPWAEERRVDSPPSPPRSNSAGMVDSSVRPSPPAKIVVSYLPLKKVLVGGGLLCWR
jgi:hypothetical protein